jgi:hypothetical protein
MSRYFVSSFLCALGLVPFAACQENITRPLPDAKQLGISGNWMSSNGVSRYRAILEGGYYISESLIGIVRFGITKQSPEERSYAFGARYEFKSSGSSVPYLVGLVEFHDGDRPQTAATSSNPKATLFQAGAGINYFLNPRAAAYIEIVGFKESGVSDIGTDVLIGLRVYFK